MQEWEKLLGMKWPQSACDRSGECCRGAAQLSPWDKLLQQAAEGSQTARNFLSQYIPYPNRAEALLNAPDAVEASLEIARMRGDKEEDIIFYHCIYLKGQSACQIYEDRPALCRDFPESPFGAIPKCCGYSEVKKQCLDKIDSLKAELQRLKVLQAKQQETDV